MSTVDLVPESNTQYGPSPSFWGEVGGLFISAGEKAIDKEFSEVDHERDTAGVGDRVDNDLAQMRAEINAIQNSNGIGAVFANLAGWQWLGLVMALVLSVVLAVRLSK